MVPVSEVLKKEHFDKIEFLQNELRSLGVVESDRHHLHNGSDGKEKELKTLAENIKGIYYQAYKTAYSQKEL